MMRWLISICGMILISSGVTTASSKSSPEKFRVAVIAHGTNDATALFAGMLTVALSKKPFLGLVERDELKRLEQEAGLSKLSSSERPLQLARLAKADALLFIGMDDGKNAVPSFNLRLTLTSNGLIVHSQVLPFLSGKLEESVGFAEKQLSLCFRSFAPASSGKLKMVSFQGLRAAVDRKNLRTLETFLNIQLAHRLMSQPGLVVLERWQLNDVVFERSLSAEKAFPLAAGTQLLDGSFSESGKGLEFQIRIRDDESEKGRIFTLAVPSNDPGVAVEKIASEMVRHVLGASGGSSWKPKAEAATFAELGSWLLRHQMYPQAVQAFETALALGDDSRSSHSGRAKAYALCSYPIRPHEFDIPHAGEGDHRRDLIDIQQTAFRLECLCRAVDSSMEFIKKHPREGKGVEDSHVLGVRVFYVAVEFLFCAHSTGQHVENISQISRLQLGLQKLAPILDASCNSANRYYLRICQANYAAYWCGNPEKTLAYYRQIFAPGYYTEFESGYAYLGAPRTWGFVLRESLTRNERHGPFLDEKPTEFSFSPGTQRLIDWSSSNAQSLRPKWKSFIESLCASSDPFQQADGLALAIASTNEQEARKKLLKEASGFLWRNRELLTCPDGDQVFIHFNGPLRELARSDSLKVAHARLVDTFCYVIDHAEWVSLAYMWNVWILMDSYSGSNLDMAGARKLMDSIHRCEKRMAGDPRYTKNYAREFGRAREALEGQFPGLVLSSGRKDEDPLVVSTVWNPYRQAVYSMNETGFLEGNLMRFSEGKLWICCQSKGIVSINPDTFEPQWIPPPVDLSLHHLFSLTRQIMITPRNIFGAAGEDVWRYDRKKKDWFSLNLPRTDLLGHRLHPMGSEVWTVFGDKDMFGVGRLDASNPEWLISSRRRPAQHPLDSGKFDRILGVFPGPEKRPLVAFRNHREWKLSIFDIIHPDKPRWVFDHHSETKLKTDGVRTLLYDRVGRSWKDEWEALAQVWLFHSSQSQPELLLANPKYFTPMEGFQPHWPYPASLGEGLSASTPSYHPVMHGNDLWILRSTYFDELKQHEWVLFGFREGKSIPVQIPLHVKISKEDLAVLPENLQRMGYAPLKQPGVSVMEAAPRGLFLGGSGSHFLYHIPWKDIHAWIKAHPREETDNSHFERSTQNTKAPPKK